MENAAKALLIAGGVLIAVLLLSLFAYLNQKMASSTANIYDMLNEHEIAEFNQQFLNYENRILTVQDVATLINLAKENDKTQKFPTKINVVIGTRNYYKNSS